MPFLRNLSIERKLIVLVLGVSLVVVSAFGATLLVLQLGVSGAGQAPNLAPWSARGLGVATAVGLVVLAGSSLVSLRFIRRHLVEPISALVATVRETAQKQDFSQRAIEPGARQLGELAVALNGLIEKARAQREHEKQAEQRRQRLFDGCPLPLWQVSPDDQRILAVNEAAVEHYGYSRDEFLALKLTDLDDRTAVSGSLQRPTGRQGSAFSEERHLRKDGSSIAVKLMLQANEHAGKPALLVQAVDVTEQRRAEEALRFSEACFRAGVENLAEGLILHDSSGRVLFGNSRMAELVGCDPEKLEHRNAPEIFTDQQAAGFNPGRREFETELTRGDGSRIRVAVTRSPLLQATGEQIGTVSVLADLTARKKAEAEIAESRSKLIEVSRLAGMAEVATGVLHNVGNVLNSVNVSANIVADRLRQSRLSGLQRTVKLLEENANNLSGFFADDPKGRLVPEYLRKLAWQLESERTELVDELAGLTKNLEHIKEVVAMQQNYARVDGVREDIRPAVLFEDALRINEEALVRHRVTVERDYDPEAPSVSIEKNKVLEILINLITNARHAVSEVERPDRLIRLHVGRAQEGKVCLEVSDNGVGISEENLVKVFQHGFTTKKNGHGFGLHSGALAIRQMGGSLTVRSDGPGLGATFRLELPVSEASPANN